MTDTPFTLELPPPLVERIARRAADLVAERHEAVGHHDSSPYMTIPETAEYLRCKRHRVDDLLSQRTLTRIKDGRRTLVSRAEVDDYLHGRGRDPRVTPRSRTVATTRPVG